MNFIFQITSPDEDSQDEEQTSSEEIVSSRPSPTQITLFTPTTPNIPTIMATPASEHTLSVIEEASESLSKVMLVPSIVIRLGIDIEVLQQTVLIPQCIFRSPFE